MGGFLDEVLGDKPQRGPTCSVAAFLNAQAPKLRGQIVDTLAKPPDEAPSSAIWRAMKRRGFACGQQSVARHRNGSCACGR